MRAILVALTGLGLVACASPPKLSDYAGVKNSRLYFAIDQDVDDNKRDVANPDQPGQCLKNPDGTCKTEYPVKNSADYATVVNLVNGDNRTDDSSNLPNCQPHTRVAFAPLGLAVIGLVQAGVDWYFTNRENKLDEWKKAASATYSKLNRVKAGALMASNCLLVVRVDPIVQKDQSTVVNTVDFVALFKISHGTNYYTLTPIYVRAGRSVAATSEVDGKTTIDTSFAVSTKEVIAGKPGEPGALKDVGSGTATVVSIPLNMNGRNPDDQDKTPTDMIPNPPGEGPTPVSLTVAVSETGHPSDVDQLKAETKALQTAVGAAFTAVTSSQQ